LRHFRKGDEFEGRLRAYRHDARPEFVNEVAGSVRRSRRGRWLPRLTVLAAVTAVLLGLLATVGGLSYASSRAHAVSHVVAKVLHVSRSTTSTTVHSAADNQYPKPPSCKKKCVQLYVAEKRACRTDFPPGPRRKECYVRARQHFEECKRTCPRSEAMGDPNRQETANA
jgi:hypothetical protein